VPVDVALLDEVGHDPLRGPLGDAHAVGDVADPDARVAVDAQERLRVVREEGPRRHAKDDIAFLRDDS